MFDVKSALSATVCLVAVSVGGEAVAVTMKVTVSGTVFGSYDTTGVFGAAGTTLDGQAYTLRYTFDTARGNRQNLGPDLYDSLDGGGGTGFTNPTISADLTIGGYTQSVAGQAGSGYYVGDAALWGGDTFAATAVDLGSVSPTLSIYNSLGMYFIDAGVKLPDTIDKSFTYRPTAGATLVGEFIFHTYDYATSSSQKLAQGNLSISSVTVAAVPLPAAGLTLVGALGGLGAVARRRRRAA